ncbi:putative LRR receptor-like serine/threonine-protein kinase [Acorus gramineus]|uniref:LRR receptor-like serine/threonine-protein kinase n=1 Tax=Acorus gramineus TaxID=55184 RepID=A0AAV9AE51_ACOGR|nr:putative LRR receptor-like serine/threonine-protein kinase [Acorus gramineus]
MKTHSLLLLLLLFRLSFSLNNDGVLLLSFKYSVLSDPLSVLSDWNYDDDTPCSWNGVVCTGVNGSSRVVGLNLPNSRLLGTVPSDLGLIDNLRHLDLSDNSLNGTLPDSLFSSPSALLVLSLSNNEISGELPDVLAAPDLALQSLNLSDNAFVGRIPGNFSVLPNLTVLSLSNNYFSGELTTVGGFEKLEVLDLSSNLVNGSLPSGFSGGSLRYLNLSYNRISGEIPPEFGKRFPARAVVDLSFNNLTGEIPDSLTASGRFSGNPGLCGRPLRNTCPIPSTPEDSPPPNATNTSTPAIAVMPAPKTAAVPSSSSAANGDHQGGLRPAAIVGIVVGDLGGIGLLFLAFLYVYQAMKKKKRKREQQQQNNSLPREADDSNSGKCGLKCWCCSCLRAKGGGAEGETSEVTTTSSSDSEAEAEEAEMEQKPRPHKATGSLVTVDNETELELENLLKASAYILGVSGSSIVYKAVLTDGTTFAVRRIGEAAAERFRDFDSQIRLVAKVRHPNLVRLRGYYWGDDEKLIVYDYVPNGSLANVAPASRQSPVHMSWESRLRIARGVARGLAFLHEKKHVHGNLKPSNVLLGPEMEPRIADFGLDRLALGEQSGKAGVSARHFGSKRSTLSRESLQDAPTVTGVSPVGSVGGSAPASSPYHAPESLRNLKPSSKWDVYSFGMILLELLSGRVFSEAELSQWNAGLVVEDKSRIVWMVDAALRSEVEGKEEMLVACFKLGFACASLASNRRPSMKEAMQILDRLPSSSLHPL